MALVNASTFSLSTTKPVFPSSTTSTKPPTFVTMTGTSHADASSTATPKL